MQGIAKIICFFFLACGVYSSVLANNSPWEHSWEGNTLSVSKDIQFFWNQNVSEAPSVTEFENGVLANTKPWIKQESIEKYTGYGTYHFSVNNLTSEKEYAIRIDLIYCEYRVWINDQLCLEVGQFTTHSLGDQYDYGAEVIPFSTSNGVAEVYIEVSNFSNRKGGIVKPLVIGEYEPVSAEVIREGVINNILVSIVVAIALYSLLLFFFTKHNRWSFFYFSLLCLGASARTICINTVPIKLIFPELPDQLIHIARYIGFFWGVVGAVYYFSLFNQRQRYLWIRKAILIVVSLASLLIIFGPRFYHSYVSLVIQLISAFLIVPGVYHQIRIIRKGNRENYIHLFGLALFVVVFIHELLAANNWITSYFYQNIGILIFALMHMAFLVYERQNVYQNLDSSNKDVESLSAFSKSKIDLNESLIEQLNAIDHDLSTEEKDLRIQQLLKDAKRVKLTQEQMATERIDPSNEAFLERLVEQFPDLSVNEKQLCIYLKANLNNKQIAEIKGIAPASVKRSKTRLRKRLDLETGENISEYLSGI